MDLSNKSLALLLLAAIVVSLGGTMLSLNMLSNAQFGTVVLGGQQSQITGQVPGWASVNITNVVGCSVTSNVFFGTSTAQDLKISTDLDNSAGGFNNCAAASTTCGGLMINNTGNLNLNVTFNASQNGTTLLGGTGDVLSDFTYMIANGSVSGTRLGCENHTGITGFNSTWFNITSASSDATKTVACFNLTAVNTNDIITLEFNVTVESTTPGGLKNATIQVDCLQP